MSEQSPASLGSVLEERPFFKNQFLPQLFLSMLGFPECGFISIDVTDQCNLRCRHCYFFEQEQDGILDAEGWERRILELKRGWKVLHGCSWVGGEPLLRRDVIERCRRHFGHNIVVTNGSLPLPDWPDVYFHVSIDGDERAHDTQRRQLGLYRLMKKNVSRKDLHVTGAMCVTSLNVGSIEAVLADWRVTTHIRGIMFDFYTPVEGLSDDLWIGWEKRDAVIGRLLELKRTYGDFIAMPERVLELMRSTRSRRVTDDCVLSRKGRALTTRGEIKEKCVLGPKADCDRCGCIVPFFLHYREEGLTPIRLLRDRTARWLKKPAEADGARSERPPVPSE